MEWRCFYFVHSSIAFWFIVGLCGGFEGMERNGGGVLGFDSKNSEAEKNDGSLNPSDERLSTSDGLPEYVETAEVAISERKSISTSSLEVTYLYHGNDITEIFKEMGTDYRNKNAKMIKFKREIKDTFWETSLNLSVGHKLRHRRHKMPEHVTLPFPIKPETEPLDDLKNESPDVLEKLNKTNLSIVNERQENELLPNGGLAKGDLQTNKIIKTNDDYPHSINENKKQGSLPNFKNHLPHLLDTMPEFSLHQFHKQEEIKPKLKKAIRTTFSANMAHKNLRKEGAPRSIIIPIRRIESSKTFMELENERSYNEELFNQVGTYDDNWIPLRERKKPNHFSLPIPNIRTGTFKDRILTTGMGPFKSRITDKPQRRTIAHDMNLVLFGRVSEDLAHLIRNCGSYMSVDLLKQYSLGDLMYSGNRERALIIYIHIRRINNESYNISLERIKRIIDHILVSFNGLSVFNLYPYEEQLINQTIGILQTEEKRLLLNMNDQLLDYCAQAYPSCYVKNNLDSVLWAIHQTYKRNKDFNFYNAEVFERQFCLSSEVCNSNGEHTASHKQNLKSPGEQLRKLPGVLCMFPHHRIVELVLNAPMNLADLYKEQEALFISEFSNYGKRTLAQTGLILQDILPLDLKKYDKNRPPKYEGHATDVYFHVTVLSVDSINEESMTYVADIFLAQSWRDHRLRLPENMTEEYRILDVEWLHNIWRPDCFFKNAKQVTFHEMSVPNHYLWLYHDKTLLYMAKLTLVLSCAMKFETYPHDTQICSMMIESLSHTTHDLVFKWNETDPLVVNPDIELPQLDISRNNTEDCTLTYSTGNFTCLAVVFNLRRRLGYHLFHTYIPSAITVVMSWISFWIKPEAIPARVTLGVTSLLTLATQNQQSQSSLPPVSYIKAIDVWMSSCTVFVFASLLEFGLVNHFMNAEPISKDMTGYSIEDLTNLEEKKSSDENGINGYGRSRSRSRSRARSHSPGQPQYVITRCSGKDIAVYIDQFSRIFFPFSFLVLNISYWTNYGHL